MNSEHRTQNFKVCLKMGSIWISRRCCYKGQVQSQKDVGKEAASRLLIYQEKTAVWISCYSTYCFFNLWQKALMAADGYHLYAFPSEKEGGLRFKAI